MIAGCPPKKNDGCTSDAECKGSRVCTAGVCTDPTAPAPSPASPTAEPTPTAEPAPTAAVPLTPAVDDRGHAGTAAAQQGMVVNPPANHERAVVRAAPSLDAAQVTTLARGTPVTSLEMSKDGQFHQIRWTTGGGGSGWIHRDVVAEPGAAPKAAKVPLGGCSREGQFCLLNGTTAGVCMTFGALSCATPTTITHHDGCRTRRQACRCGTASGTCDLGSKKEGLYCQCAAAAGLTPVSSPPCGCKRDGITYERNGMVWGCEGGGNWCASSPRLAGGCPKRPGCN
jgi:hypothetical protein